MYLGERSDMFPCCDMCRPEDYDLELSGILNLQSCDCHAWQTEKRCTALAVQCYILVLTLLPS